MNTLTIAGAEYPVKYGRSALIKVMKLADAKGLAELTELGSLNASKWGNFVLAGIENGCKISGDEAPKLDVVNDHLDEYPQDFIQCVNWMGEDITPPEQPNTEGN